MSPSLLSFERSILECSSLFTTKKDLSPILILSIILSFFFYSIDIKLLTYSSSSLSFSANLIGSIEFSYSIFYLYFYFVCSRSSYFYYLYRCPMTQRKIISIKMRNAWMAMPPMLMKKFTLRLWSKGQTIPVLFLAYSSPFVEQ